MEEQRDKLQTPAGLRALAYLFIIAPIGNILLSFVAQGIPLSEPAIIVESLRTIALVDALWLAALPLCGILLLMQHKTAWAGVMITMFVILAIDIKALVNTFSTGEGYTITQPILALISTVGVLIIFIYFRYPYLDRRSRWLTPGEVRYKVNLRTEVIADTVLEGVCISLSRGGARLNLREPLMRAQEGGEIDIRLPELSLDRIRVELIEMNGNVLRVRFLRNSVDFQNALQGYLELQAKAK